MDKSVRQAADQLAGIIIAIMHPVEMRMPSYGECEDALNAYHKALEAEFEALAPRDHECGPRSSPGLKTHR